MWRNDKIIIPKDIVRHRGLPKGCISIPQNFQVNKDAEEIEHALYDSLYSEVIMMNSEEWLLKNLVYCEDTHSFTHRFADWLKKTQKLQRQNINIKLLKY